MFVSSKVLNKSSRPGGKLLFCFVFVLDLEKVPTINKESIEHFYLVPVIKEKPQFLMV